MEADRPPFAPCDPDNSPINSDRLLDPAANGWKTIPVRKFFRTIGPLWARRENDNAWSYGLLTTEEHENDAGVIHGGVLATFVDQAFSTVAWEAAERQPAYTVTLDIHYAGAVRQGRFLIARARVVRRASSLIFLTGNVVCDDREVVIASGVWSVSR